MYFIPTLGLQCSSDLHPDPDRERQHEYPHPRTMVLPGRSAHSKRTVLPHPETTRRTDPASRGVGKQSHRVSFPTRRRCFACGV